MVAGSGPDIFTVASGDGNDQIYGFNPSIDILNFIDQTANQVSFTLGSQNGYSGIFASYTGGTVFVAGVSSLTTPDIKFHT
jgi:hypothetical protein